MTTKPQTTQDRYTALAAREYAVETNAGTYSAEEAARCGRSPEPQWSEWTRYETVGGDVRTVGDRDGAPGRERSINRDVIARDRQSLAALRADLLASRP